MNFIDTFLSCYGQEGLALALVLLFLLGIQLYYYTWAYGRIANYKINRRKSIRESCPPISIVIPMFAEDSLFLENRLPLFLAQDYENYEVVVVYVGQNNDFYEEILRLCNIFPRLHTTKVLLDPHHPISRKMALNIGIKLAHNDCIIFSSTEAYPESEHWLSLMAKGYSRGDIVLGYCGKEVQKGFFNYFMRCWQMMHSCNWIHQAIHHAPYNSSIHCFGFTKSLYHDYKGFHHLNMNIGENDLFVGQIATAENSCVVLAPRATLRECYWGGWKLWLSNLHYYGSAEPYYPITARNFGQWEVGSRVLFFIASIVALCVMPLEFKIGVATLLFLRLCLVLFEIHRIARRLGEPKMVLRYLLYDLLSPVWSLVISIVMLRRDIRVWR